MQRMNYRVLSIDVQTAKILLLPPPPPPPPLLLG
jgi:hypothetical protein